MGNEAADKMLIIQTMLPRQQQLKAAATAATRNGCVLNISFLYFGGSKKKKNHLEKLLRFPLRQVGFLF